MTISGTTEKCKACDKTVHIIDLLSADGISYHKTCFKCSHCNGVLVMGNYCSMDGVLYCKPHFEQLFKETGTYTNKNAKPSDKPNALVTVEGEIYHKSCFRCSHGDCVLTPSTYAALEGFLYCKHHFSQLFKEKGSYTHLTETSNSKKSSAAGSPEVKSEPESDSETKPKEDEPKPEAEAEKEEVFDQPVE